MFLFIDSVVYEWNLPNPNASFPTLKKSSIIPLIGLYSFQFFSLLINVFPIDFISDLSSFASSVGLKDSKGYEIIAFNLSIMNLLCGNMTGTILNLLIAIR